MTNSTSEQEALVKAMVAEMERISQEKEKLAREQQEKEEMEQQLRMQRQMEFNALESATQVFKDDLGKHWVKVITSILGIVLFWGGLIFLAYKLCGGWSEVNYVSLGEVAVFVSVFGIVLLIIYLAIKMLGLIIGLIAGLFISYCWVWWIESLGWAPEHGIILSVVLTVLMLVRFVVHLVMASVSKKKYREMKEKVDVWLQNDVQWL